MDEFPTEKVTAVTMKIMHSPYNRMMVRDISLIILAVIAIIGLLVIVGSGRTIPPELWGLVSTMIGAIIGSMGRYNGQDSTIHPK